jgi:hypothetical protein
MEQKNQSVVEVMVSDSLDGVSIHGRAFVREMSLTIESTDAMYSCVVVSGNLGT